MKFPWMTDDDTGTVFRDVIFLIMIMFVVLFYIALMHINPVAKKTNDEIVLPAGNVTVNILWGQEFNADVDLWVKGPLDDRPVGYANKSGRMFNLLRDDLGHVGDNTSDNFENAYSRGLAEGEYIVNVHLYARRDTPLPLEVSVIVTATDKSYQMKSREIYNGTVTITTQGQEITAVAFELDKNGHLVPGTVNNIQRGLRAGTGF